MTQSLQTFFQANELVVLAIYAQAYFVLGLAVALQWRKESSLVLARTVPLLSAFGLCAAVAIWGDIFIPLQTYLAPAFIHALRVIQSMFFLISFGALLHFGLRLNWDKSWANRIPWAIVVFGAVALLVSVAAGTDVNVLRLWVERIGRPLLIFPGAFLAAWGLRGQAERIEVLGLPEYVVDWLRIAGFSFGTFAIFGGLIVPTTPDGKTWLDALFGIPVAVPRALIGGVLAYAMIRGLRIFRHELQRMVAEMGRARALAADRQRIGRELHDGTIQVLYGTGLMLENVRHNLDDEPDSARTQLETAMQMLNQTIADIRRYIFDLSSGEDELTEALGKITSELETQSDFEVEYRIEGTIPQLRPDMRSHLLQMVREALSNAQKHSKGDHVTILLRGEADALRVFVADNGQGLPAGGAFRPGGQGIPNLRARARLLNGDVSIRNRSSGGAVVEIEIPYSENSREDETESAAPNGSKQPLIERTHT